MQSDTWYSVEDESMKETLDTMFDKSFDVFRAIVEEFCNDNDPELVKRVNDFCKVRKERMKAVHVPSRDGFNCIVHNDSWCNNFMFK